jgi:hypothetical protein
MMHAPVLDAVLSMLSQLISLSQQEVWWEIHAHLLSISGTLLESYGPEIRQNSEPNLQDAIDIINTANKIVSNILNNKSSDALKQWSMVALAGATKAGEPLTSLFVDVLANLSNDDRSFFLCSKIDNSSRKNSLAVNRRSKSFVTQKDINLQSSTGIPFSLQPVTYSWSPIHIASSIENYVMKNALDRLDSSYLQILSAAVLCASEVPGRPGEPILSDDWISIYTSLKDYIFVGFCDANSAESSASIVMNFILYSKLQSNILMDSKFMGILRLLYPSDSTPNVVCQSSLETFLRELYSVGSPYEASVVGLIDQFSKAFSAQYAVSSLQRLSKEFS